jgi:hypothetical protein
LGDPGACPAAGGSPEHLGELALGERVAGFNAEPVRGHRCVIIGTGSANAVIEVGGYGLAHEEIGGTLAQDAIAITGQERAAMLALAARMNLDGSLVLRALAACPPADAAGPGQERSRYGARASEAPLLIGPGYEQGRRSRAFHRT